jgi:hypothetical protein
MKKLLIILAGVVVTTTATAQLLVTSSPESFNQEDLQQMKHHYIETLNWMEEHCGKDSTAKYAKCGYLPQGAGCRSEVYQNCKAAASPITLRSQ